MEGIAGSPPDLRQLPAGCAFQPRCKWAVEHCAEQAPELLPLEGEGGREVACWRQREGRVPAELAKAYAVGAR
jgi:peptide/nickel transport system ATP-binding protein